MAPEKSNLRAQIRKFPEATDNGFETVSNVFGCRALGAVRQCVRQRVG
jgi:hypothetical protein